MTQILGGTLKELNKWSNTLKAIILVIAIAVFSPILYFLIYPQIGSALSIVIYFIYLFIIAIFIRFINFKKLDESK